MIKCLVLLYIHFFYASMINTQFNFTNFHSRYQLCKGQLMSFNYGLLCVFCDQFLTKFPIDYCCRNFIKIIKNNVISFDANVCKIIGQKNYQDTEIQTTNIRFKRYYPMFLYLFNVKSK